MHQFNFNTPKFQSNTSWSVHLPFRPREVTDTIKNMLAETLIRNDVSIRQLLRQCKDKWIMAVTVGQDTMHLMVFDPTDVDKAHQRPNSSAINRPRTSFFSIDRELNIRQLAEERVDDVMRTAPMIYSDRALKTNEIRTCDAIQSTMMQPVVSVSGSPATEDDTLVVWDNMRPDFSLEPSDSVAECIS